MVDIEPKQILKDIPTAPGIYQFLGPGKLVLYVGKARNLRKRVTSYYRKSGLPHKTRSMMQHIVNIEVIQTHTESEALLLESNLIKEHRPRYNIVLRDDKSYPYIRLDDSHEFPRLCFYRGSKREPGQYYGPYASAGAVRETLSQLQKIFSIRQCEDSFYKLRSRPCLQYQIQRCSGPCVGLVSAKDYAEDIAQAILFLEGRDQRLTEYLADKMERAAENLEYENAGRYRDRIKALRRVQEHQYVNTGEADADVIVLCTAGRNACVDVTFVRGGRHSGSKYFFPSSSLDETPQEILTTFLVQFYLDKPVPRELIVSPTPRGQALIERALGEASGHAVKISSRLRTWRARLVERALLNADAHLKQHIAGKLTQLQRIEELKHALQLEALPSRIECLDASHTLGESTVVSCVVFDQEGARKSDYRRFNINDTKGDDYAALSQAITRRYRRLKEGEGSISDLVIIDGGKGQLNAVADSLAELQIEGITLVGVAKGAGRKAGRERLFLLDRDRPLILSPNSPALHCIQQIRDEAHRFAITGHRQQRGKSRIRSQLQDIEGVGDARRKALLKHFGGLQEVARAGIEDLSGVPGINAHLAQRIYEFFH